MMCLSARRLSSAFEKVAALEKRYGIDFDQVDASGNSITKVHIAHEIKCL